MNQTKLARRLAQAIGPDFDGYLAVLHFRDGQLLLTKNVSLAERWADFTNSPVGVARSGEFACVVLAADNDVDEMRSFIADQLHLYDGFGSEEAARAGIYYLDQREDPDDTVEEYAKSVDAIE